MTLRPTIEQHRIINHTEGHTLVFAVSGSGKTTPMIECILHLVRNAGVRPHGSLHLEHLTEKS